MALRNSILRLALRKSSVFLLERGLLCKSSIKQKLGFYFLVTDWLKDVGRKRRSKGEEALRSQKQYNGSVPEVDWHREKPISR